MIQSGFFGMTFLWGLFFAAIAISRIFYVRARSKERIALIEKGIDPKVVYKRNLSQDTASWQKVGIVIVGIALGILFPMLLAILFPENEDIKLALPFLMIVFGLLFGGVGMIIASLIDKSRKNNG